MTEDYVSFKTAKLLKEKGFPQYKKEDGFVGLKYNVNGELTTAPYAEHYAAPSLHRAIKWMRENGFHIYAPMEIDYDEDERGDKWYHDAAYYPEIRRVSDGKIMYDDGTLYTTPEQACEVAIRYCLENYF